jgi:IclR family transcriptional regulator, acetate operon repressor
MLFRRVPEGSNMAPEEQRPGPRQQSGKTQVSRGVQSLNRAMSILNALANSDDGLTLTVLARQVALPPSSTHRLLTTLQQQRFVRFDSTSMSWHIGVQAFVVGNAFAQSCDVVALAKSYMRRLMEQTGETVNLYVLNGGGAICMAQVQSPQMIRAISRPGGGLGMHRSAAGKCMLANMAKQEVVDILAKHGLPRSTRNTIGSVKKLNLDLARTRSRGFAVDDEEFALGLRCVAAPIFDEDGRPHAALSVAGPTARITRERVPSLGEIVAAAARSVTIELGHAVHHRP